MSVFLIAANRAVSNLTVNKDFLFVLNTCNIFIYF